MTTAAGLRVHVLRHRVGYSESEVALRIFERRPKALQAAEMVGKAPTPLGIVAGDRPIAIDPIPPSSQYRVGWSLSQIVRYLVSLLRLKLTGRLDEQQHAVTTRQLFERLGGVWIKVGQLISLRSDVLSDAMARELSDLQFQVRGFPPEVARAVIEEDLGRPLSAVFAHFEMQPFAAASIAQVHRATLLANNRAVVVKVMRPDVIRSFARDFRLLEGIVRWMGRFGLFKRFQIHEGLAELRAILDEETNYEYEAVNLKRMRRILRKHDIHVPRLVRHLSTRRVLVIEEVLGVVMSQYMRLQREDPERANHWAVTNGIDNKTIIEKLTVTLLRQILEDNEFHGDLHPGNIMLLADNRIALIDFGSVGKLNIPIWKLYRYSIAALAARDYPRAADMLLMMSPSVGMANIRRLRRDMAATLSAWELRSQFKTGSYADRSLSSMSNSVARVMARHGVPLNWEIMRVGRSLSTLDASVQALVPDANFMSLCRVYFQDKRRRMRTREYQGAVLRGIMARLTELAGDADMLLGPGIRERAMQYHGIVNRLTKVRILFLSSFKRILEIWLLLLCSAFVVDVVLRDTIRGAERFPHLHLIDWIDESVPSMHPLYWILAIGSTLYCVRLLRNIRAAIARLE